MVDMGDDGDIANVHANLGQRGSGLI
jgi:hypothetical protein